jgi:hypothetical protein
LIASQPVGKRIRPTVSTDEAADNLSEFLTFILEI